MAPSNTPLLLIFRAPVGALYQPLELVDPLLVGGGGVQEIGRHGDEGGRGTAAAQIVRPGKAAKATSEPAMIRTFEVECRPLYCI